MANAGETVREVVTTRVTGHEGLFSPGNQPRPSLAVVTGMAQKPGRNRSPAGTSAVADLDARLRAVLTQLTPAERKVAELMSEDPGRVAQMTITELAEHTSTSTATVVRAAKSLGFEGYPQLRFALATQAGRTDSLTGTEVPRVADIVDADDASAIMAKLAAFEASQIAATSQLASPEALEVTAAKLVRAPRRCAFGIGSSGLVAQDLTQKITRIGLAAAAYVEHDAALVAASLLGPDDIVLAISHSGETPGTVEPARQAHRAGASVTAITGSARSTLARLADSVLLTAGVELGLRSAAVGSRTSQLLVVDALFVRVTQLAPSAAAALQTTHDVIADARKRGR